MKTLILTLLLSTNVLAALPTEVSIYGTKIQFNETNSEVSHGHYINYGPDLESMTTRLDIPLASIDQTDAAKSFFSLVDLGLPINKNYCFELYAYALIDSTGRIDSANPTPFCGVIAVAPKSPAASIIK